MYYNIIGATGKGNIHEDNSDYILKRRISVNDMSENEKIHLIGVADGITNTPFGGSVARWLIDKHLAKDNMFKTNYKTFSGQLEEYLENLHKKMNDEFRNEFPDFLDSGCTLSLVGIYNDVAECYWAGDTSIYISRRIESDKFKMSNESKSYETTLVSKPDVDSLGKLTNYFSGNKKLELSSSRLFLREEDIITILSDGFEDYSEITVGSLYENSKFNEKLANQQVRYSTSKRYSDDSSFVAIKKSSCIPFL